VPGLSVAAACAKSNWFMTSMAMVDDGTAGICDLAASTVAM
jgi:hypothetical protein